MVKSKFLKQDQTSTAKMGGSRLVLGTAGLGGVWGKVDPEESLRAILFALERGVRAVDTAPAYGDAEHYVGKALRQWQGTRPFLSTKVGRLYGKAADDAHYDFSPGAMRASVEKSLLTLKVPLVDLLFLHDPSNVPVSERDRVTLTLQGFQGLGLTRQIGLGGNLDEDWLTRLPEAGFSVAMGYNRLNICNQEALDWELPVFDRNGIAYYAASPLHMGLLGDRFVEFIQSPPPFVHPGDVQMARILKQFAESNDLSLSSMAHRFLFSLEEADRVVIGARTLAQLIGSLADWEAGPLPDHLFHQLL